MHLDNMLPVICRSFPSPRSKLQARVVSRFRNLMEQIQRGNTIITCVPSFPTEEEKDRQREKREKEIGVRVKSISVRDRKTEVMYDCTLSHSIFSLLCLSLNIESVSGVLNVSLPSRSAHSVEYQILFFCLCVCDSGLNIESVKIECFSSLSLSPFE